MVKSSKNIVKNAEALKHTNLMLVSTTLSMCTGVVLLLVYTALKGSMNFFLFARGLSMVMSAAFLASAVVLGIMSVKKDKCYIEFCIYSFVMSFGFLSLLGVPFFLNGIEGIAKFFVTQKVIAFLAIIVVIYFIISLIYHTVKSSEKRK